MTQDVHADDPRVPVALIQAIRQKDCILLVGPGLCRYVRTPMGGTPPACWKDALRKLITVCKKNRHIDQSQKKELDELVSSGDILKAGSKLQGYLKAKDESQFLLSKRLEEVLLCDQAQIGSIYLLLAQIPFCIYCTINYDSFIEDAYLQTYEHDTNTFNLTSIEDARQEYLTRKSKPAEQKFVLKLLGDVKHPASLNLGDRNLQDWLDQNVEKAEALDDIFLDSPILLIGFESGDAELEKLLANTTVFNPAPQPGQYSILLEGESQAEEESLAGSILRPIQYKSETDLRNILENIVRLLGIVPVTGEKTISLVELDTDTNGKATNTSASPKTGPVHVFISWIQQDELQKRELLNHLNSLVSTETISVWAGEFSYGIGEKRQTSENLEKAEISLPLMSTDYFNGQSCQQELKNALAQYSNDNMRLIPVLLRMCEWQLYFGDIDLPPVLPDNGVPLMESEKPDRAYTKIVETIARVVEQLRPGSQREQKSS